MNAAHLKKRVYIRLATEKGSFVYNPELGSDLFKLLRGKNLEEVREVAEGYIRRALSFEIRAGFILGIENVRITGKTLYTLGLEVDVLANNREIVTIAILIN